MSPRDAAGRRTTDPSGSGGPAGSAQAAHPAERTGPAGPTGPTGSADPAGPAGPAHGGRSGQGERRLGVVGLGWIVGRLLAGWVLVLGLVIGLGLLVTGPAAGWWPLSVEDDAERGLQEIRNPVLDRWTDAFGQVADTATIIALCAVAVWVLHGRLLRWWEALLVAAVTAGQSAVFLSTTLVIDRARPVVPHLDEAPPTSSFPSGHSSAALALFGALALVVHRQGRPPWARRIVVALLLAVPPLVMASRMYRGMHHPSDIAGSILVAGLVLLWSDHVLRTARHERAPPDVDARLASPP